MKRIGNLELEEDTTFQKREWAVERVGWIALLAIVVAATVGALGSGPISDRQVTVEGGSATARYSGIVRRQTTEFLEVQLGAGEQTLTLSGDPIKAWTIEKVTPQPKSVTASTGKLYYEFEGTNAGQLTIQYQAKEAGIIDGVLHFPKGKLVQFRQTILP